MIPRSTFFACTFCLASEAVLRARQALIVILTLASHVLPLGASLNATYSRFVPARLTGPTSVRGNAHLAMRAAWLASTRLVICQVTLWASKVDAR